MALIMVKIVYQNGKTNVGINGKIGQVHVEINGLKKPESEEANRILQARFERNYHGLCTK